MMVSRMRRLNIVEMMRAYTLSLRVFLSSSSPWVEKIIYALECSSALT